MVWTLRPFFRIDVVEDKEENRDRKREKKTSKNFFGETEKTDNGLLLLFSCSFCIFFFFLCFVF